MDQTERELRRESEGKVALIIQAVLIFAAIGLVFQLLFALGQGGDCGTCTWGVLKSVQIVAFAALNTICAFAVGILIGFLFGIPKTERPKDDPKPAPGAAQAAPAEPMRRPTNYIVNANLEEISDWLTKIIVGIGLIELRNVPGYLTGYGEWAAAGLGGDPKIGAVVAQTVFVAYLVLGMLAGYLITRLYVAPLLPRIDTPGSPETRFKRLASEDPDLVNKPLRDFVNPADRRGRQADGKTAEDGAGADKAMPSPETREAARAVPLEALGRKVDVLRAYASTQIADVNYREALRALQIAVEVEPDNADLHFDLAYCFWLLDDTRNAFAELDTARTLARRAKDLARWGQLSEQWANWKLYVETPTAAREALAALDEIVTAGATPSGASLVYRAAANGQLFRHAKASGEDGTAYRATALTTVTTIRDTRDPGLIAWITRLWDPYFKESNGELKDTSENDLEVFFDDPAFKAILAPPRP
ncbi:hypothetical protein sos41_18620 [Alphaproteobacteria bacterium SO-S41]|nr:hypothetical protein sos41_18620 [Alphaproteobacteria bacterium SO-S41]